MQVSNEKDKELDVPWSCSTSTYESFITTIIIPSITTTTFASLHALMKACLRTFILHVFYPLKPRLSAIFLSHVLSAPPIPPLPQTLTDRFRRQQCPPADRASMYPTNTHNQRCSSSFYILSSHSRSSSALIAPTDPRNEAEIQYFEGTIPSKVVEISRHSPL